jgi:hypothetical protein
MARISTLTVNAGDIQVAMAPEQFYSRRAAFPDNCIADI